jgi:ATP-dependent Clp protease ATP-binding subunit ClpC
MWRRWKFIFSQDARRIILIAQNQAIANGHIYVGTHYLLFSLVHEGSVPKLLQQLNVPLDQLKAEIVELVQSNANANEKPDWKKAMLTAGSKKVLELAAEEARMIETPRHTVEPEHILLALLRFKGDLPASYTLLHNHGVKLPEARSQVKVLFLNHNK